jgi:formylglycine-generating enzyme required for sulfatase activity
VVLVLIPGGVARIGSERIRFGFDSESPEGLVVKEVRPDTIASAAGLTPGDQVIAVNGVEVRRDADLPRVWPTVRAGESVRFRVRRGTEEIEVAGAAAIGRGSPGVDPWWKDDEGPRHEVRLDPYFISKYEMTQGQWERLARAQPSRYHGGYPMPSQPRVTLAHPVEQVSFEQAAHWLPRADLALPTEAQWEHAARGGTESIWSTGDDAATLEGHANLDDRTARRTQAVTNPNRPPEEFDDGWSVHAPVGRFRPNPYGLHDMHGNVQEHCADWWDEYGVPAREGDGLREGLRRRSRVLRGGSWTTNSLLARSAVRGAAPPDQTSPSIGIRAARAVEGLER